MTQSMSRALLMLATLIGGGALLSGCDRRSGSNGETVASDGTPSAVLPGKTIYERSCFSCHSTGAAGAPKIGDTGAWQPRIAKGRDALMQSVLNGVPPGMPQKGLCAGCTDAELGQALDYIIASSK